MVKYIYENICPKIMKEVGVPLHQTMLRNKGGLHFQASKTYRILLTCWGTPGTHQGCVSLPWPCRTWTKERHRHSPQVDLRIGNLEQRTVFCSNSCTATIKFSEFVIWHKSPLQHFIVETECRFQVVLRDMPIYQRCVC